MQIIQKDAKHGKDGTFSSLFEKGTFQKDEFLKAIGIQNKKISIAIAEYFERLYTMLSKTQRDYLIKKIEKIEQRNKRK
jgi:hypothetical protein